MGKIKIPGANARCCSSRTMTPVAQPLWREVLGLSSPRCPWHVLPAAELRGAGPAAELVWHRLALAPSWAGATSHRISVPPDCLLLPKPPTHLQASEKPSNPATKPQNTLNPFALLSPCSTSRFSSGRQCRQVAVPVPPLALLRRRGKFNYFQERKKTITQKGSELIDYFIAAVPLCFFSATAPLRLRYYRICFPARLGLQAGPGLPRALLCRAAAL